MITTSLWFDLACSIDLKTILGQVKSVLKTGMLTQSSHLINFEELFSDYLGTKYTIGVNSGGTALEIALRALDPKNIYN